MPIISEIKSLFKSFKGRFVRFPERQTLAVEMASKHKYEAREIVELLSTNTVPDEWGPKTTNDLPVDYARFSINWIAQLDDGLKWLFKIGLDENHAWYVRQEAFICIAHTKTGADVSTGQWKQVIEMTIADETTDEIRSASLKALVNNQVQEALPVLQSLHDQSAHSSTCLDDWHDGKREVMMACAALGSNSLIPDVMEFLFDGWWHKQEAATNTMESITKRLGGVDCVAKELLSQANLATNASSTSTHSTHSTPLEAIEDHPNPAVVRWSLTQSSIEGEDQIGPLIKQLGNSNWGIRTEASNQLAKAPPAIKESTIKLLNDTFRDPSNSRIQRSWCAYTLNRLGLEIESLFPISNREEEKELWQTPWSFEFDVDPLIRTGIAREYGHITQPETDVRYCLEQRMTKDYSKEQATADREQLIAFLQSAGIAVTSAENCGDHHQQGGGTFWVLGLGKGANSNELYVSTLGKFVCYVDVYRSSTETTSSKSFTVGPKPDSIGDKSQIVEQDLCKRVARELGFLFPNPELLKQKVPGLNVYFFGRREPLSIKDLLFYWQD